ncbi:MAG TPA: class I SAM-dependent methyltransferase [Pyrinomonadaceae bacterium]
MPLLNCLACGGSDLNPFLDLGSQPLANSYHTGSGGPSYPLAVVRCRDCTHSQLTTEVPPDQMFRQYAYVSGTTETIRSYFDRFVAQAVADARVRGISHPRVLDIACNDGTLLEVFREHGCRQLAGVDPAENLHAITAAKGFDVVCDYWTEAIAQSLGAFDIVVAMNVLGHTARPLEFLEAAALSLSPEGRLYVQTSQAHWLERGEFDCVYHEHISYFTPDSLRTLARRAGLRLEELEIVPVHGGSLRVTFTAPYAALGRRAEQTAEKIRAAITHYRAEGFSVAGYGAAAKGNTLLNFAEIDLAYIVDDNPLKWGLLTPGRHIPIYSPDVLANEDRLVILLLAWNFAEEIRRKVATLRGEKETVYIMPFPEVRVC